MKPLFLKILIIFFLIQLKYQISLCAQNPDSLLEKKVRIVYKLLSVISKQDLPRIDTLNIAIFGDFSDSVRYNETAKIFMEFKKVKKYFSFQEPHFRIYWDDFHNYHQNQQYKCNTIIFAFSENIPISDILDFCAKEKILSITLQQNLMVKGFSLGVDLNEKQQPVIILNMNQLAAEGYSFDTEILQIANIKKVEL